MNAPQRVQVFGLGEPPADTPKDQRRYRVRWRVDGRDRMRRFKLKAEAERYRSMLLVAVGEGVRFDRVSGLPETWQKSTDTWWSWSREWLGLKWGNWAGHSRRSSAETLALITPYLVRPGAPTAPRELRSWLLGYGYLPGAEMIDGVERSWLDRFSLPLVELRPGNLEPALVAVTTRLDGQATAATVSSRRRNTVKSVLTAAVRRDLIKVNPMDRLEWKAPKRSEEIDVSVLPSLVDVDQVVRHVSSLTTPGARYGAFFAVMGMAGLRPSEVAAMRVADLDLPDEGWGLVMLRGAIATPGARYTASAEAREHKGLKHRSSSSVRAVPLPPDLVMILRAHLQRWPARSGLVFTNRRGDPVAPGNYGRVWTRETGRLWPKGHPLAETEPYDLRHTAATLMIRAGVPLPEVARRLGHSVEILLRVYAGVFEDERNRSNEAIEREFERQRSSRRVH